MLSGAMIIGRAPYVGDFHSEFRNRGIKGGLLLRVVQKFIQSGASSLAKHGGAYFSAVYGSIQDPIAAPGLFDIQVR